MPVIREALLDTSVVIAYLRDQIEVEDHANAQTNWYVSPVTAGELLQGVILASRRQMNEQKVRKLLDTFGILAVTEDTAEHYAQIAADLESRGSLIPQNDMWIAACALEHNLPVATRDIHFQRVKGLQVLMW
jgi:tRNA(fMet)-specific endonuclease VapC